MVRVVNEFVEPQAYGCLLADMEIVLLVVSVNEKVKAESLKRWRNELSEVAYEDIEAEHGGFFRHLLAFICQASMRYPVEIDLMLAETEIFDADRVSACVDRRFISVYHW